MDPRESARRRGAGNGRGGGRSESKRKMEYHVKHLAKTRCLLKFPCGQAIQAIQEVGDEVEPEKRFPVMSHVEGEDAGDDPHIPSAPKSQPPIRVCNQCVDGRGRGKLGGFRTTAAVGREQEQHKGSNMNQKETSEELESLPDTGSGRDDTNEFETALQCGIAQLARGQI